MDPALQNEDLDEHYSNVNYFNEIPTFSSKNSFETGGQLDIKDESNEICQKSTFRNMWQAKKRLQAFSPMKHVISPTITKTKLKTLLVNEKTYNERGELQENLVPLIKPPKKSENSIEKAKAVVEEIEMLKRIEIMQNEEKLLSISYPRRSRSKSSERDFVFRKREKKVRNYRRSDNSRRSPSPIITKAKFKHSEKVVKLKYPKNWEEFSRDRWTFEKLSMKFSNSSIRNINLQHDITKQLLFETPAEIIKPFYFKDEKGEEILVPYQYLRYTTAKPTISYNLNPRNRSEQCLTREETLSKTNKNFKPILEKFLNKNTRTKFKTTEPIGQRTWYQKNWKDNESRVLETSIGLSFLQNYSDDDEEDEEEEFMFDLSKSVKISEQPSKEKNKTKQEKSYPEQNVKKKEYLVEVKNIRKSSPVGKKELIEKYNDKSQKTDKKSTEVLPPKEKGLIEKNKLETLYGKTEENETVGTSWTPERIMENFEGKKKEDKNSKKKMDANRVNIEEKQRAREILSADEWDETPKRKKEKSISEEIEEKKVKKTRKKSDSESSSRSEKKISRKKKKKLDKKKQKEKEKKARKKKEKLKAEKIKLKKEKKKKLKERKREAEKEILKKLKEEIEQNLVEVEREERENDKKKAEQIDELSVKVKIEKEENREVSARSSEDLRNFLDKKVGKVKDLREKVEERRSIVKKKEEIDGKTVEVKKDKGKKNKETVETSTEKVELEEIHLGKSEVIDVKEDKKKRKSPKKNKKNKLSSREVTREKLFNEDRHREDREKVIHIQNVVNINEMVVDDSFSLEKSPTTRLSPAFVVAAEMNQESSVEIKQFAENDLKQPVEESAEKPNSKPQTKSEELVCETTPDTDQYHSNWESDDGISPIVKMASKKTDKSWESDEEIFDRKRSKKDLGGVPFVESPLLEMPLHIKKFSSRDFDRRDSRGGASRSRTRSPEYLDVDSEIKLLEAERINLSKERIQLEIERIRIHELERKNSMEDIEYISKPVDSPDTFRKGRDKRNSRWDLRENHVDSSTPKAKKELTDGNRSRSSEKGYESTKSSEIHSKSELNYSSKNVFTISSSPEITSTKSPVPTVLESAYQEFMKAVSVGDDSKGFMVISSAESEIKEVKIQRKTRLTRSERDRNREKNVEISKVKKGREEVKIRGITDPKVLQDILLPGEVPIAEIPVPRPVPVPSPKLEILHSAPPTVILNLTPTASVQEPVLGPTIPLKLAESPQPQPDASPSPSKKPFSFSSLVLSSKRPLLLEKSNWKVDDESDEELPPATKKLEDIKIDQEKLEFRKDEIEKDQGSIEDEARNVEEIRKKREPSLLDQKEEKLEKIVDERRSQKEKDKRKDDDDRRKDERSSKRRHSRSRSPVVPAKDKRRKEEDSRRKDEEYRRRDVDRKKEEESKRRDEESRRRERGKRPPSPLRHREPSPRRRRLSSPVHKRSPPRHRSPSRRQDYRRSDRGERRSPPRSSPSRRRHSHSPPKQSSSLRRRSASPREKSPRHHHYARRSKSPGGSPLDGLKRSVADSTISDDLLPQPYVGESSNSPLNSSAPASVGKRSRISLSPKRPSLDERINQVLGIETQQPPPVTWKPVPEPGEYAQQHGMAYSGYHQHEHLPGAVASTTSKVLQVGNILQVVPSEEICLPPPPVHTPSVQKIVQVGNMLQIVPTEMEPILPPLPPPPPPKESPPILEVTPVAPSLPEKQSAEAIMSAKNAERMAERAKKRLEKEERKKEKERKKREKDKRRKIQLKITTEEMIKRALEMDGLIDNQGEELNILVPEVISDTPGLDPSKSILSKSTTRYLDEDLKTDRRKSVKFADGVRPGEGTSPSGGEELSSPPPQTEVLPKTKKYRKIDAKKKKRKIKVKVIKKRQPAPDSDEEYENLPPPSPPPGSPPLHVFPARVKVHTINNIPQHYLPAFGISTAAQQTIINPTHVNVGYQTPPAAIYRPPPPPAAHVVGGISQHYTRTAHVQQMGVHVHPPPQHMHPHGAPPISHRDHQPYGSF